MNAPDSPPTWLDAIAPPFFTASLSSASAAVEPCVPTRSSPIASRMRATLSPSAGVGASDRSTMPKGTPSFFDAARPTSSPMRVILKAVRLITLASWPKSASGSRIDRREHDAGAAHTNVDHALRFPDAVEGAGHERVVLDSVAEHDELGAAEPILRGGELRGLAYDAAHARDGIHVDAGLGGADIHGRAHALRLAQHLRKRREQSVVAAGHALVNERGVTAEKIHADFARGAIERKRERRRSRACRWIRRPARRG